MPEAMYKKPDWFTTHVVNPLGQGPPPPWDRRAGLADARGAGTEERRDADQPGEPIRARRAHLSALASWDTQWVRNLRAAGGEGELRSGRKVRHFHAEEVADSDKLPLLRLYMDKWSWEVKGFMGIDADAPDEELRRIAPDHPAFVLSFED